MRNGSASPRYAFRRVGFTLQEAKRTNMASNGVDFLGLVHDLSKAISDKFVTFWPREALVDKMHAFLNERRNEGLTLPGTASNILDCRLSHLLANSERLDMLELAP